MSFMITYTCRLIFYSIYLVDHAWTYRLPDARAQLMAMPGLLERMANLMEVTSDEEDSVATVEAVYKEMWRYSYACTP